LVAGLATGPTAAVAGIKQALGTVAQRYASGCARKRQSL
jgi:F0F1-type ATP synthase membrane subunit c/vacuolar-type H+-ATPase subunit K